MPTPKRRIIVPSRISGLATANAVQAQTRGFTPPVTFSEQTDTAGISISSSGMISLATPLGDGGTRSIYVRASDAFGAMGKVFTLTGVGGTTLAISGTPVTTATQGSAYAGFTVSAVGGQLPYTYSLTGTWPTGITINSATGAISGTTTQSGSFTSLGVRVTDAAASVSNLSTFTMTVASAVPVNSVLPVITVPAGGVFPGQVLVVSTGTFSNISAGYAPVTYSYQWKRGATNVGTNSNSYTLVEADVGSLITCIVTATNVYGASAPATSAATAAVGPVGYLFGFFDEDATDIDMSDHGFTDWIVTKGETIERKSGGGTTIAFPIAGQFQDVSARVASWTDGDPTASGSSNELRGSDNALGGASHHLDLTFPASASLRRAIIYCATYSGGAGALLSATATLSDGSTVPIVLETPPAAGVDEHRYFILTVDYSAASSGQTLTVAIGDGVINASVEIMGAGYFTVGTQPLILSSPVPSTGAVGVDYSGLQAEASGGTPPYNYSLVGSWPPGITINPDTGVVDGVPSLAGFYQELAIQVEDQLNQIAQTNFSSILISATVNTPVITTEADQTVSENVAFSLNLTANQTGITWSKISGLDAASFTLTGSVLSMAAKDFDTLPNEYSVVIRATNAANEYVEKTITLTIEEAMASIGAATAASTAASTSLTQSWSHTVALAAGRGLLVSTGFSAGSDPGTISGVTYGGVAMTLLKHADQNDAGKYSRNSVYWMPNPPVGTATVEVTRSAAVSVRWYSQSYNVIDADLTVTPEVLATPFWSTTDAATYAPSITPTFPDSLIVGFIQTQAGTSSTITTDGTLILSSRGTGSNYVAGSAKTTQNAASAKTLTFNIAGGTNGNYGNIQLVAFKGIPHRTVDPIYYVANSGSLSNDGLSESTPFKYISQLSSMTLPAGAEVLFNSGEHHRPAPLAAEADYADVGGIHKAIFSIAGIGTSALPIRFGSYGSGAKPIISGDVLYPTGWSAPSGTSASAFCMANGQKRNMGVVMDYCMFPVIDGVMHQPAQWSPAGVPSSMYAWDDSDVGTDSFYYPPLGQLQLNATEDLTKKVRYRALGTNPQTYEMTIEHPSIGTHYGANSPVGASVVWRAAGNVTITSTITEYSQAAGTIKALIGSDVPHKTDGLFYYAIRYSPYDITRAGEYAYSADRQTLYVVWLPGTVKSVVRYKDGVRITGNYVVMEDIAFANVAADSDSSTSFLNVAGLGHQIIRPHFNNGINNGRPPCIMVNSDWVDGVLEDPSCSNVKTHSFLRGVGVRGLTFSGLFGRDMGRSACYFSGGTPGDVTDITVSDIDINEHLARHGNGFTTYGASNEITFDGITSMGSTSPITSQIVNANPPPNPKNIHFTRGIITQARLTGVGYDSDTPIDRSDGGDFGSTRDQMIEVLTSYAKAGWSLGHPAKGAAMSRSVFQGLTFEYKHSGKFTASRTGTTLTVTAMESGVIEPDSVIWTGTITTSTGPITGGTIRGQITGQLTYATSFTGSKSGTLLTVSGLTGTLKVGDPVYTTAGTFAGNIVAQVSGTAGAAGTYTVSTSATVASTAMRVQRREGTYSMDTSGAIGSTSTFLAGYAAGYGVTMTDCLVLTHVYRGEGTTWTNDVRSGLPTLTNVTWLNGSEADWEAGTNGQWNGCFTEEMQEMYTTNDARDGFVAERVGPAKWGPNRDKGPWIIPAFGDTFDMVDVWATTDTVKPSHQAGKALCHIAGGSPGSELSLPSGVGANNSFTLDRGVLIPSVKLSSVVGTTYLVSVDETTDNVLCENGPSRRTVLTFTVGY